jgi:hypothetical protein
MTLFKRGNRLRPNTETAAVRESLPATTLLTSWGYLMDIAADLKNFVDPFQEIRRRTLFAV